MIMNISLYNGIDKPKCYKCKKKLGLFYIKCKCNNIFCNGHRYSEEHDCTYNYYEENKNNNIKNNEIIKELNNNIKLNKI